MDIIINTSSMTPIYEQIVESVKKKIASGKLTEGGQLPSVRVLSRELRISALTVKKAYDQLEREGYTATVHGKGSFVKACDKRLLREEQLRELEQDLEQVVKKARRYQVSGQELIQMLELMDDTGRE